MLKYFILTICFVASSLQLYAQNTIKGLVKDQTGEVVIGASVLEKGHKTAGVITAIDGKFTLKVRSLPTTLSVSYLGYETQEVLIKKEEFVTITLKSKDKLLNEVVVVGYGTQKKINATGAVKTIDNEVLQSRPITNAVQGLQGAIAGLNITSDVGGTPGAEMNINIRGIGSIGEGSNSSPLILIDGMEGNLSSINPDDIANISVLKDAAAASIYGSRATFGVILVTTKNGKAGQTRVSYSGNLRLQQPVKVPDMVDARTLAYVVNDAYINSGGSRFFSQGQINMIQKYMNGEINYGTEPFENIPSQWKAGVNCFGNTDWYEVFVKKHTTSSEHNLSITGGSEMFNYYLSAGYLGQTGLFNYSDERYNRFSFNAKTMVKPAKFISIQWLSRIIATSNEKPTALNSLFYHNIGRRYAMQPLYLPNGEYHGDSMVENLLHGGRQAEKTQQFYNQLLVTFEPIKDWKIYGELCSRIENNPFTKQFKPIYYTNPLGERVFVQVLNGVNATKKIREDGTFHVYPAAGENYFEKAITQVQYFTTNLYTDYHFKFMKKQDFKLLLGMQSEYFKNDISRLASSNILLPESPFLQSEIGGKTSMISDKKGEWASLGVFSRINYNYADRYMAEVNVRADGASRFPPSQRWAWFPSFSAGWNIAQEPFWQKLYDKGFQYLKIRGSYGILGNQNTQSFYPYYQQMIATEKELVLNGEQAKTLPMFAPYSTKLTWERIENIGLGLDIALFKNKLSASFDWYRRTTKDMVGPAKALAAIYGANAPKTNNAELCTKGWELELSWHDKIKDFSYSITASLSDYQTIITKYDSPDNAINGWYKGKNAGDIWGYRVLGIAKSDDEMKEYIEKHPQTALGQNWGGGDIMYKNLDNDPSINAGSGTLQDHGDMTLIGNNTPRFAYSLTLEGQWKCFDLRGYFQGIGKRDYIFTSSTFYGFESMWQFTIYKEHLDYFRYAGAELGANLNPYYGRVRYDGNNIKPSDRFLQNASYLRLKNLQIGFTLSQLPKFTKCFNKARLYLSGENLFTFTKLRIYDPEAILPADNIYDAGAGKTYPQYRTWSMGLQLTF